MDKKIKHLEMIQGVITRMANNSFKLKGWTITLVVATFAFIGKDIVDRKFILVLYLPIIAFWALDSYYLQQERLFRSLYEYVRKLDENDIDFSMKTNHKIFDDSNNKYCSSVKSKTEIGFYLPVIIVVGIIIYICELMITP